MDRFHIFVQESFAFSFLSRNQKSVIKRKSKAVGKKWMSIPQHGSYVFGYYDKLKDNLVKLKSPKLLYKFRCLEMKQY